MRAGVYVSNGEKVRLLSPSDGSVIRETVIEDCGAVCACGDAVYAASERERTVYRLDGQLLPCGVFAGGPGMSAMRAAKDGERLFVLLSDADSVLMLGGRDGMPMLLARVGANPRQMRLEGGDRYLTIAGGRDGSATVLSAYTLEALLAFRGEGICCDAVFCDGRLFALLLTPSMNTCLMLWEARGQCLKFTFPGEPGSLCRAGNALLVSAGQWLYVFDAARMHLKKKRNLYGPAGKLIPAGKEMLLLSPADEWLRRLGRGKQTLLCPHVRDAACE